MILSPPSILRTLRVAPRACSKSALMSSMFDAHSHAHHILRDTARLLLAVGELLVRCRSGVNHESLGITHIGEMAREFDSVDEGLAGFTPAAHPEGENRAIAPLAEVLVGHRLVLVGAEARIRHP